MEFRNDVLSAIDGDNQAMERLYNNTYPKLRAVTISILKNENDAEDIIQESYIKAFSNLHQLEDASKFEGWLCRIASNKCKDYLKKHKPVLFSDLNKIDDEDDDPFEWSIEDENADYNPEAVAISDDTRRQLMELVNSLPDEQRICLIYYAVEEMKISEIAELLEVPEATVKSRLKYAKDKMKNKIETLEKQGVKIRSVSGFALIPFLYYLFSMEAKAATLGPFGTITEAIATATKANGVVATTSNTVAKTVITETAKQVGTKAAVGLGAKIAALPIVTKITAAVVSVGIVVGIPVAVNYNNTNNAKSESNYIEGIALDSDDFASLDDKITFEETVIVDETDFCVKVLNVRVEDDGNYILDVEFMNKSSEQYDFYITNGYINGIFMPDNEAFRLSCEVGSNMSRKAELIIGNRNLHEYIKKITEIKLTVRVDRKPVDAGGTEDYESSPIYPFGQEYAKTFDIGTNYELLIYSNDDVSLYLLDCYSEEDPYGNVEVNFFIENRTDEDVSFITEDYVINGLNYKRLPSRENDYLIQVGKNKSMFYTLTFKKFNLEDNYIYELKNIAIYAALISTTKNDYNIYFRDILMLDFATESSGVQRDYSEKFSTTGKLTIIKKQYANNVHFIKMNQICKYDLDGDGMAEEICVTAQKESNYWYGSYYTGKVNVTIDGTEFLNIYDGGECTLSNYYCIIDIDKNDSKLHIAIQDYGPSSDYSSSIFEYANNSIERIGTISGVFDRNYGFYDILCYGDGTICSYIRLGVLETWFGKSLYKLEDSEITFVEQNYYESTESSKKILLVDLTAYENQDINSTKTIIPAGTAVVFLGTDDKEWIRLQTDSSDAFWVKLENRYNVLVDTNKTMSGYEVFDGLSFAD